MTNATQTQAHGSTNTSNCAGFGTTVPYASINEPGCYICNWSGHLLRVPEDGVTPGRSPLINIVGCEPLFVTKISDNPYIPVTKAKMLACDFDLHVTF
jgi:hypothetical protein